MEGVRDCILASGDAICPSSIVVLDWNAEVVDFLCPCSAPAAADLPAAYTVVNSVHSMANVVLVVAFTVPSLLQ